MRSLLKQLPAAFFSTLSRTQSARNELLLAAGFNSSSSCGHNGAACSVLMTPGSGPFTRSFTTSQLAAIKVPGGGDTGKEAPESSGFGAQGPPSASEYLDKDTIYPDTITTLAEGGVGVPMRGDIRSRGVSHVNMPTMPSRDLPHGNSASQAPPYRRDSPGAGPPPLPDEVHGMAPVHVVKEPSESMKRAQQSDEPRHVDIPVYDVHLPYSEEYVYDVPDIARAPGSKHAELYTPSGRNTEVESHDEWSKGSAAGHSGEMLAEAGVYDGLKGVPTHGSQPPASKDA